MRICPGGVSAAEQDREEKYSVCFLAAGSISTPAAPGVRPGGAGRGTGSSGGSALLPLQAPSPAALCAAPVPRPSARPGVARSLWCS